MRDDQRPPRLGRRSFLGALGGAALGLSSFGVVACRTGDASAQRSGARCARCGMRVTRGAAFSSGARTASGEEVLFDAVKCMFTWLAAHPDARDPWVTEHLSRAERPARSVFYVIGTTLQGPMGYDLVPVDTAEHAEQIRTNHHGRAVVRFEEVTSEVLANLMPERR